MLWTRLAPRPLEGGGMPDSPVAVDWQIAEDEKFARVVAQGTVQAIAGGGPCRARRGQGPAARPALLVSLPRRQRLEPDRPHAHGAGRRQHAIAVPLRLRLLPAVRAGLLRRLSRHGEPRPRSRRASRRLHLREVLGFPAGAPARGRHPDDLVRVPRPLRALQARSRPAGRPCRLPVARDLGRPRGRRRLCQRPLVHDARSRAVHEDAGGRLSGLLRAPAVAGLRPAARPLRHDLRALPLRRHARRHAARRSAISIAAGLRRRRPAGHCGRLPRAHARGAHHAGQPAGAVARPPDRQREGALDHRGPADADGRARAPVGRRAPVLDGRLGRLSQRPPPPARLDRDAQAAQSGRHRRRPPRLLRRRPQARLRPGARARPRQRVRRHLDHLPRPERCQHCAVRSRPIRSSSTRAATSGAMRRPSSRRRVARSASKRSTTKSRKTVQHAAWRPSSSKTA